MDLVEEPWSQGGGPREGGKFRRVFARENQPTLNLRGGHGF